jgi:CheY-like chemotaxis protein/HPt (histidine-containing phosphotransfer) domain-containing protein
MRAQVGQEDELLGLFEQEADERLNRLSEQLPRLAADGDQTDLMASVFRDAHSIRGAAAVVGLESIQHLGHVLEGLLEPFWRRGGSVSPRVVEAAMSAVEGLKEIIPAVVAGEDVSDRASVLERKLAAVSSGSPERPATQAPPWSVQGEVGDQMRGRRGTILVVDDAATVREMQRSILEDAGYRVRTASDGAEALALLSEARSDLVVADVEMPRLDGFALTEAIRAEPSLAAIPVIILTSRSSEADRRRGLDSGADAYMVKSTFDRAGLLQEVDRLLDRDRRLGVQT